MPLIRKPRQGPSGSAGRDGAAGARRAAASARGRAAGPGRAARGTVRAPEAPPAQSPAALRVLAWRFPSRSTGLLALPVSVRLFVRARLRLPSPSRDGSSAAAEGKVQLACRRGARPEARPPWPPGPEARRTGRAVLLRGVSCSSPRPREPFRGAGYWLGPITTPANWMPFRNCGFSGTCSKNKSTAAVLGLVTASWKPNALTPLF